MLGLLCSLPGHRRIWKVRPALRCSLTVLVLACAALAGSAQAQSFKFSNPDPSENKAQEAEQKAKVQAMLDTPCRDKIKNQKIMVLIGESRNGAVLASQASYGPHFESNWSAIAGFATPGSNPALSHWSTDEYCKLDDASLRRCCIAYEFGASVYSGAGCQSIC